MAGNGDVGAAVEFDSARAFKLEAHAVGVATEAKFGFAGDFEADLQTGDSLEEVCHSAGGRTEDAAAGFDFEAALGQFFATASRRRGVLRLVDEGQAGEGNGGKFDVWPPAPAAGAGGVAAGAAVGAAVVAASSATTTARNAAGEPETIAGVHEWNTLAVLIGDAAAGQAVGERDSGDASGGGEDRVFPRGILSDRALGG